MNLTWPANKTMVIWGIRAINLTNRISRGYKVATNSGMIGLGGTLQMAGVDTKPRQFVLSRSEIWHSETSLRMCRGLPLLLHTFHDLLIRDLDVL